MTQVFKYWAVCRARLIQVNDRLLLRFAADAVLESAGKAGLRWTPEAGWAGHDYGMGREH